MTRLPPGQRKLDGFPRFGGPFKPPTVPASPALEITGAVREPVTVAVAELAGTAGGLDGPPKRGNPSAFRCPGGRGLDMCVVLGSLMREPPCIRYRIDGM